MVNILRTFTKKSMLSSKAVSLIVILLMISSSVSFLVHSSNESNLQPTVIMFGHSFEEESAKTELQNNFPLASFVEYSSILNDLDILDTIESIIWLGHGSVQGIVLNKLNPNPSISWDDISSLVKLSTSQDHYFLACDSITISKLTKETGKNVFSFEGQIDSIWSSNLVSIFIASKSGQMVLAFQGLFKLYNRISEILAGDFSPLGTLSEAESRDIFMFSILATMAIALPITLAYLLVLGVTATVFTGSIALILVVDFVAQLFMVLSDPLNFAGWLILVASMILAGVAIAIFLGAVAAAASATIQADAATVTYRWPQIAAFLLIAIAGLLYLIDWSEHDRNDCNDEPARFEGTLVDRADCPPLTPPPKIYL